MSSYMPLGVEQFEIDLGVSETLAKLSTGFDTPFGTTIAHKILYVGRDQRNCRLRSK